MKINKTEALEIIKRDSYKTDKGNWSILEQAEYCFSDYEEKEKVERFREMCFEITDGYFFTNKEERLNFAKYEWERFRVLNYHEWISDFNNRKNIASKKLWNEIQQ